MTTSPKISHKKHLKLVKDYEGAARLAALLYVSDTEPGIIRKRAGKGFSYILDEKPIKDKQVITRIQKLAVPPAWNDVWICKKENGHIQATGIDAKKRKQYRYHPLWTVLRNETKFHKMIEFGKALPQLRLTLEKDLAQKELNEKKVLAAVISLMQRTYIRIGNSSYVKMNGSHGLTTLHDKHVNVSGSQISFSFKGKTSIHHDITLTNKKLAKIVQQCRDIPGKELFQYYDENGERKAVDSGMVNSYLQEITHHSFTAKDFRTWAGCLHFLLAFKNRNVEGQTVATKTSLNEVLDEVSKKLGNTRTVCRKYYVHPGIIKLYEENKLNDYLQELDEIEENDNKTDLTKEEKVLMAILEKMA
ncbi:MAG: DNA topoisomerase IB [Chitinophagaceae bacterium]|nr:MAG: DNA topoisomerase IB [Chitinophagaceae bacterium]